MDDHNPRKSKAFLITFIIVLILLVGGFLLFRNINTSTTKSTNEGGSNKIFESLFGTNKAKDLTTVDTGTGKTDEVNTGGGTTGGDVDPNGTTPTDTGNPGGFNIGGFGTGDGIDGGAGFGITPPLDPITLPDGDDDWGGDGDNDMGDNNDNPRPPLDLRPTPIVESYCPNDDPLAFTDAEKVELEALLKEYYTIAYLLKTEDDIALLEEDIKINTDLVAKAESLNTQCEAQKGDYRYSGPRTIKSNPYYTNTINSITPYVPTYEILEELFKVW